MVNVGKISTQLPFGYSTKKVSLYSPVSHPEMVSGAFFLEDLTPEWGPGHFEPKKSTEIKKVDMNKISLIL